MTAGYRRPAHQPPVTLTAVRVGDRSLGAVLRFCGAILVTCGALLTCDAGRSL